MDLNVKFTGRDALVRDILSIVGPAGRHDLFSVGAKALQVEVQRHVRNAARSRHKWSTMLDAKPTGHLTRSARAITWHASSTYGVVEVAIPGITRAFGDLAIRPVNADKLTIPATALSYGRRVAELQALGWKFFRGRRGTKGEHILFGRREKETRVLYWLKDEVTIPMDRDLLPSDRTVADTVNLAFAKEIMRVARKVCGMA